MPFPISTTGNVEVDLTDGDVETVISRLISWLERERVRELQRHGNLIEFEASSFCARKWHDKLGQIDGSFEVTGTALGHLSIRYTFRLTKILGIASAMVFVMSIPFCLSPEP